MFDLRRLLRRVTDIDVVHIHKFNQRLSPFIFLVIPRRIKVVCHVHDFMWYCPYRGIRKDGSLCDGKEHATCLRFMVRTHDWFFDVIKRWRQGITRKLVKKYVDAFIVPSLSLKDCLEKIGIPSSRIAYIPYFIEPKEISFQYMSHEMTKK